MLNVFNTTSWKYPRSVIEYDITKLKLSNFVGGDKIHQMNSDGKKAILIGTFFWSIFILSLFFKVDEIPMMGSKQIPLSFLPENFVPVSGIFFFIVFVQTANNVI